MDNIQLPVDPVKKSDKKSFFTSIRRTFLLEKLLNPLGITILLLTSIIIAISIAKFGVISVVILLALLIGLPTLYAIIAYPKFGIIVLLVSAYLIMWVLRMGINFPLGTLIDGLQVTLIFGFLLKQKFNPNWKIYKNPISLIILVWIGYNLLQVANPIAESRLAWLYTIRSVAFVMLMYFVFMYHIRSVNFIKLIFKIWLFLSLFAALYAFKQEHFGFFAFEEQDLIDPLKQVLLFINGQWRKFSIFSDPVAFAYNMVASALLCIGLMCSPISIFKKVILAILAIFFLRTMLYSGTRGAYVLFPAALILLAILNFNKQVLFLSAIGMVFITFLIMVPTTDPTLARFQSAFRPSDDASFNVRKHNQKKIQPYIQSHPFGGGLGATGAWGQRFSPNSFLANFPPDSGYVRVAVELGWVGLLLFCTFMFLVLRTGIINFYRIKDPSLKSYCLAMVLIVFALNIGNYPQEALVQFPTNIYFYLVIALINVTRQIDQEIQKRKMQY